MDRLNSAKAKAAEIMADPSFNQTEGVLECIVTAGVLTTAPLQQSQAADGDHARMLLVRAFSQLDVDNRRIRIRNLCKPVSDLIDEAQKYFEIDPEENAILLWQTNIQIDMYMQAQKDRANKTEGNDLDSLPDIPLDVVMPINELCAAMGMYVLTFEGVRRMIEYYEANNRMRKINDPEFRNPFEKIWNLARNPEMFSKKLLRILSDLATMHTGFESGRLHWDWPARQWASFVAYCRRGS